MSVIQSTQPELRYIKRQNLEHEARVIGNYYRDLIRSYGVDCIYHKLDTSEFDNFKKIIDKNTIMRHAYGYNDVPDYSMSAHTLTYMEVENDIFQLNKFGLNPNADVNFYFENNDFACSLATKTGQYKEYKIDEINIECEVPEYKYHYETKIDPITQEEISVAVGDTQIYINEHGQKEIIDLNINWPYELGLGYNETYTCGILSGKYQVSLSGYELNKETTVVCNPYEHVDFNISFDSNSDLYKSMKHIIENDDYLETMIFLTYKVSKIKTGINQYKYILTGKIHGSVLFYDIKSLQKYAEKIHPSVGDIITIDFPDENNREKYEITDCFDKQLTQDGISPLLHKYIWKCKARRFVDSYNEIEQSEADMRLQEKRDYEQRVNEEIAKEISFYDDNQDAVYGGYEFDSALVKNYDKQDVRNIEHVKYEGISEGQLIDIATFECGSKLCTDGYNLVFMTSDQQFFNVATIDSSNLTVRDAVFESGIKWLKATKDKVFFINIEGNAIQLVADDQNVEINLDSAYDLTIDSNIQDNENCSFVKFGNCRTYLFATDSNLYAHLESNNLSYQLI